ncbi:hypothetical protein HGH92_06340 [Chitinophaga varians]|uniref:Uncharacterized protein n=1 Tax=Chitinophaga varians TaxID=2202339 RepID=A0A847RLA7_9BACT|nr:hypothetical protein [Chitinophaga varians]NLR63916.1 hypothetical protein [Chitinophaga varians]
MGKNFRIEYWLVARPKWKLILALAVFFLLSMLYIVLLQSFDERLSSFGIPRTLRMVVLFIPFLGVMLGLGKYVSSVLYRCEELRFTKDSLVFIRRGRAIVFKREDILRFKVNEQMDKGLITNYFITMHGITYSIYTNGTAVTHDFIHQAFVCFFALDAYLPVVQTGNGIERREYVF